MILIDMQGLPEPTPALAKATSALRSPRTLRSPRQSQPTDRLLAFASLISSLVIYNQVGNITERMLDSLEPIAKFSDQIQREIAIEAGVTSSILSSVSIGSTGNMSERSMNSSSFLDMTQTVSNDLKDLICPNIYCVMRDYTLPEDLQQEFGRRKGAKKILE